MKAVDTRKHRGSLSIAIASTAMSLYLRFVYATSRWCILREELNEALAAKPTVVVFWHARLAAMPYLFKHAPKKNAFMLISAHRDGELIARTVERLGYSTVRGSTARQKPGQERAKDKGGAAALRQMIRLLKSGASVGITPDGPRGPRMRISPGTIALAALSHVPIIGATYSCTRAVQFNSWDRFLLPLPFGRIHVDFTGPLFPPETIDGPAMETARLQLEDMMNQLTQSCDRAAGRAPVEPAPPAPAISSPSRTLEEVP